MRAEVLGWVLCNISPPLPYNYERVERTNSMAPQWERHDSLVALHTNAVRPVTVGG